MSKVKDFFELAKKVGLVDENGKVTMIRRPL